MTPLRRILTAALVAVPLVGGAAGDLTASAARTTARTDGYRIVFASNRDGKPRAYSMLPDGSRLTPLLRNHLFVPQVISRDGRTVVYRDQRNTLAYGTLYASRASGAGLRRLARGGDSPALSRDGKFLAYSTQGPIWIVGTNARGRRRVTSGSDNFPDWSPDGRALVYVHVINFDNDRYAVVVQPLHGKRRVLVRIHDASFPVALPTWSPDGRWIAYLGPDGLYLVRPNGGRRHRIVRGEVGAFMWSPDGRRVAFMAGDPSYLGVIGTDGGGLRRLPLGGLTLGAPKWSPDGSELLLAGSAGEDPGQIWVVGSDGSGLRRLTSAGQNDPIGWTRLAPVLTEAPLLPPSERVLGADTVATRAPVGGLSADGTRVAFITKATATDCDHVVVWSPGDASVQRFAPLPSPCGEFEPRVTNVELAGSRVAWVSFLDEGNECRFALKAATLADPLRLRLSDTDLGSWGDWCKSQDYYHLRGDGDLLVFDDHSPGGASRLVRVGAGGETCQDGDKSMAAICATLRRGAHTDPAESVSGGLIAIRQRGAVAVLDAKGALARLFTFVPADVNAARLDGGRLVVWRFGVLEVYDVATGARELSRPLPTGYRLVDVDDGVAVLVRTNAVMLLRLGDGHSLTLTPDRGPVLADLEPAGLYYSYVTGGGGRVVFAPRSKLLQQLGGV